MATERGNGRAARVRRTKAMKRLALQGHTFTEIGSSYGVSRERVRKILEPHGITGATVREVRRLTADRQELVDRQAVVDWVNANPGHTVEEAAPLVGLSPKRIRKLLGADTLKHFLKSHARPATYSTADMIASLQRAAESLGAPLTGADYDSFVAKHGGPSRPRIETVFGGRWRDACRAAGLPVNKAHRGYTTRWSDDDLVSAVADHLESPEATGTLEDYDAWARGHSDRPSGKLVRNRIGSWTDAKRAALLEVGRRRQ